MRPNDIRLNPYSSGICSTSANERRATALAILVLILILVEDTL